MQGTGTAKIQLFLEGPMSDSSVPAVRGGISASDASVRYAKLPKAISHISIACNFTRSRTEQLFQIDQCSAALGGNTVNLSLKLVNFNDPDITMSLSASMNLAEAKEYYPLRRGRNWPERFPRSFILPERSQSPNPWRRKEQCRSTAFPCGQPRARIRFAIWKVISRLTTKSSNRKNYRCRSGNPICQWHSR